MSRALEFIQRLFCLTHLNATTINSIRVSNENRPAGANITNVGIKFNDGIFELNVLGSILHSGHYSEDYSIINYHNGSSTVCNESSFIKGHISDTNVDSIEFIFSYEKKPLLTNNLIKALQSNTIFGMPKCIVKSYAASRIELYFGANSQKIQILKDTKEQLRSFEGRGCTIEVSNVFSLEIIWLDDGGRLTSKKVDIKKYLSEDLLNNLIRYSFEPKNGLKVYGLFDSVHVQDDLPLRGWASLKEEAERLVRERLNYHLSSQLNRIEERIKEVHKRRRVSFKGADLGCEPINEVETVLLFQRMSSLPSNPFPNGMEIKILDYSPKDIDSICEFKESRNHTLRITPIEFEFNLKNFFLHGHDYRQISLVICYTVANLSSPFSHGGVNYYIDRSYPIARVVTSERECCFDCLILQDYLNIS